MPESAVTKRAAIVATLVTLPLVAVTVAATVISQKSPDASAVRLTQDPDSKPAIVGLVTHIFQPSADQATPLFLFPSATPPPPTSTLFPYTTLFRSRTVYVVEPPASTLVTPTPSVFVIAR